MAEVITRSVPFVPHSEAVAVRRIAVADLLHALRQGWTDFAAIPTQLVFLCILYPVVGLVAARAAAGYSVFVPLLFPLVAGVSLLGPVLAVGIYELSRRRERGLPVSWLNAFDVLRSPALPSIVAVGLVLLGIFGAWLLVARAVFDGTVGTLQPTSAGEFVRDVLHTGAGWRMIAWGNGAGLGFAAVALSLTAVSVPMLLDRPGTSPGLAIRTSLRAVLANPAVMAVWGVMVAAVLLLGSLPLFVGLAVAMPVLGHATWHLYRRLVA